jgi:hypothetical protein
MFKKTFGLSAITLFMTIAMCGIAGGLNDKNNPAAIKKHVSPMFDYQYEMLGGRVKTAGKEKTIYDGKFFDAEGKSWNARATVQSPGLVKLEGFYDSKSRLSFDGEKANKQLGHSDEALLEMFLMDTPEAILEAAATTMGIRFLGGDFGPDPRKVPNYTGPRYDIYDFTVPIIYKKTKQTRVKTCLFDTKTGLLYKTEYFDESVSPKVKVETRFSAWGKIDESAYPAQIERYEDGKCIFTFIAEKIEGGPATDASNFQ